MAQRFNVDLFHIKCHGYNSYSSFILQLFNVFQILDNIQNIQILRYNVMLLF